MMVIRTPLLSSFLFSFFFTILSLANADPSALQTYIIQLRPPVNATFAGRGDLHSWYVSFLPNATTTSGRSRVVHKYSNAITGFAAKLTGDELGEIEKKDGFLKAYADRPLRLLTTRTPAFLGLQPGSGFWKDSGFGKGVIIGVIDSGVTANHPSFDDGGMPPPPPRWKGACACGAFGKKMCNNKIIGGRTFDSDPGISAPDDWDGHGTHTASTAAGNFVGGAEVLGNGRGTAAGAAPRAHLAIYRICGTYGCTPSGVLAAMDAAIEDGVDVLSLSVGGDVHDYDQDVIAIGAFAAAEKGIFVSCAAGNDGPNSSTVINEAPWVLTVGASTMDRKIRTTVKLGDGQEFDGESLFQPGNSTPKMLPLVYPKPNSYYSEGNCATEIFQEVDVKDKVVVCRRSSRVSRAEISEAVKSAGGAAMILLNTEKDGDTTLAEAHVLPASHVSYFDGLKIVSYLNSAKKPTASIIFKGSIVGNNVSAPAVASFSSRGPSIASPLILKPDVVGPGVSVVAGWPWPLEAGSDAAAIPNKTSFNFLSGTSMSAPHLSGIAALVKSVHPDWSPAAIKSAIMTTSDIVGNDGKPIRDEQRKPASLFAMGSGHVNPAKAADPGLVYDVNAADYIGYLCGLGYTDQKIETITKHRVSCDSIRKIAESQLNYPSISVALVRNQATVSRTVTNVGGASEEYSVSVDMPKGVKVSVVPEKLSFSSVSEKKKFTVTFKWSWSSRSRRTKVAEGHLSWISNKHVVRSPVVIKQKAPGIIN